MMPETGRLVADSLDLIQRIVDGQSQDDVFAHIRSLIAESPDPDLDSPMLILAVASAGASIIAALPGGTETLQGVATRNAVERIFIQENQ